MSELIHYGVPGMKWGQRKEYEAHPRKPGKNKEESSKKSSKKKKLAKIGIILGASAAATVGGILLAKKIKKIHAENEGLLKSLERRMMAEKVDEEISIIDKLSGKGTSTEEYRQIASSLAKIRNKKLSEAYDEQEKSYKYSRKKLKDLKSYYERLDKARDMMNDINQKKFRSDNEARLKFAKDMLDNINNNDWWAEGMERWNPKANAWETIGAKKITTLKTLSKPKFTGLTRAFQRR